MNLSLILYNKSYHYIYSCGEFTLIYFEGLVQDCSNSSSGISAVLHLALEFCILCGCSTLRCCKQLKYFVMENQDLFILYIQYTMGVDDDQWPLLLTWFNFNPSMDK